MVVVKCSWLVFFLLSTIQYIYPTPFFLSPFSILWDPIHKIFIQKVFPEIRCDPRDFTYDYKFIARGKWFRDD